MTTEKILNEKELTVKVAGRVDSSTAPDLEATVKESIDGIDSIVFDLAGLEYLSSAGLRVLLGTHKLMSQKGGMKVRNANEDIMEIFQITGFDGILTIE